MDPTAPARPRLPPRPTLLTVAALVLLALGYAWLLSRHISPYAGGADSSGYLNSAALLRAGQFTTPVRSLPGHTGTEFGALAHLPLGFVIKPDTDRLVSSYPLGLPLHLAAFASLTGLDQATVPLNLCAALAGGVLMFLLARRLDLPLLPALGGAALLLLCPLYLFSALQPMSDLLALVWALAALYAALRARPSSGWAFFCGVAVALAVLTRPSNLLLALPVVLALGTAWRRYLWVGLGGLPGALLLAWYNQKLYGSPLATGYGDVRSAFSALYLLPNLAHFARWIPLLLTPLVLAALVAPFTPDGRRRDGLVLLAWAGALIGFYAFYYHSGETWWYLRFILPAFPVLILAALTGGQALINRARHRPFIWITLLAAALIWETILFRRLGVLHVKEGEATYPAAAAWARTHLPRNAAVFCMQVSGAVFYYTDFLVVRWDLAEIGPLLAALRTQQRPVYAILYEFEEPLARKRIPGVWIREGNVNQATCWRIDAVPAAP